MGNIFEGANDQLFLRAEMLNGESMTYLLKFIAVKEPNIRYLGLEGTKVFFAMQIFIPFEL